MVNLLLEGLFFVVYITHYMPPGKKVQNRFQPIFGQNPVYAGNMHIKSPRFIDFDFL